MNDSSELGGRRLHHWRGLDRIADIAALADAMATAIPDLATRDGRIVQLDQGELRPINLAALHGLADKYIAAVRIVNWGAGWTKEYHPFQFAHRPRLPQPTQENPDPSFGAEREPDAAALEEIYRTELAKRLPRVE